MALLCRFKEMKSINLFNNFRRFYSQIHSSRLLINQTSIKPISDYYHYIQSTYSPKNLGFFDSRVRFFAAPVQYIKKEEEKEKEPTRPRLNDEIEAEVVRLVTDEGHSVVSRWEALQRARELKLDLVEVNRHGKPVVCKIMDYTHERYKQQVKGKELAKIRSAGTLKSANKEVRFSAKADSKDIKTKVDSVRRLMDRGYRVKCTAVVTRDAWDLNGVLSHIAFLIKDVAFVESGPQIDEKQGFIIVRHVKFGLPKKGKKSSTVSSKVSSRTNSDQSHSDSPVESEDCDDDVELDNEVKDPLQYQQGKSPSRSNDATGTSKSQSPNFPSNVTPAPQPQNRYAKKVPNSAPPLRTPHSQGVPPAREDPSLSRAPRQAGRQGFPPRNSEPLYNANSQHRGEIPNGARQNGNNFSPLTGNPRPPSSPSSDVPKSNIFGVFSEDKSINGRVESGVNQKVTNPPKFNSGGSVAGDNKKFGIFSGKK